jgi:hydroxymethylpyrimidine/phosphomethylpyrimidine kinase
MGVDNAPARPVVLTIAGFDPSSGAGITADLKVFAAHRLYGVSAITALTVQSTQGVRKTEAIRPETLEETLACLAEDVEIEGVKIGMLATAGNVGVVSRFLENCEIPRKRVVLDPVIRSSSGRELLDGEGLDQLRRTLLGQVGWVTPNLDELSILVSQPLAGQTLAGQTLSAHRDVPEAATALQSIHPLNVVVTGGHTNPPNDFLRTADGEEHWFPGEWIETTATHGTGCTFSSALLAALVAGKTESAAVRAAKDYVEGAMRAAYRVGKGRGPLHHLYEFDSGE